MNYKSSKKMPLIDVQLILLVYKLQDSAVAAVAVKSSHELKLK